LDAAVAAAGRAFPGWAARSYAERRALIERFADAVEARFEEFARLMTMEQGKPLDQARGEVGGTIAGLRWFAAQEIAPMSSATH
jgi:acyl-CoA reductase-like NAD-dependent aldehyde dehydrogenase